MTAPHLLRLCANSPPPTPSEPTNRPAIQRRDTGHCAVTQSASVGPERGQVLGRVGWLLGKGIPPPLPPREGAELARQPMKHSITAVAVNSRQHSVLSDDRIPVSRGYAEAKYPALQYPRPQPPCSLSELLKAKKKGSLLILWRLQILSKTEMASDLYFKKPCKRRVVSICPASV